MIAVTSNLPWRVRPIVCLGVLSGGLATEELRPVMSPADGRARTIVLQIVAPDRGPGAVADRRATASGRRTIGGLRGARTKGN